METRSPLANIRLRQMRRVFAYQRRYANQRTSQSAQFGLKIITPSTSHNFEEVWVYKADDGQDYVYFWITRNHAGITRVDRTKPEIEKFKILLSTVTECIGRKITAMNQSSGECEMNNSALNDYCCRKTISRTIWPQNHPLSIIGMMTEMLKKFCRKEQDIERIHEWWMQLPSHPEIKWLKRQILVGIKEIKYSELRHDHQHTVNCEICQC